MERLTTSDPERLAASEAHRAARRAVRVRANRGRGKDRSQPTYCGVYFVRCGNFVKIGWSVDVDARLDEILALNPQPLHPMGYEPVPGSEARDRESDLHEHFALERHRGEWYRLSPALLAYIQTHATPWPEAPRGGA